jgi:uncharacterized SAM-binding protein YcdF (DUF218 family)
MVGRFCWPGRCCRRRPAAPRTVDAVVVLGGDGRLSLERYARGRDLVLAGYSKRLILFYPSADELRDARARVPEVEVVACMPAPSSWGEAQVVRERMQAEGVRSVMVVSDPPHMLRLRLHLGLDLAAAPGLHYTLVATSPPWWPGWHWWEPAWTPAQFVGSEVLKLGYYMAEVPVWVVRPERQ